MAKIKSIKNINNNNCIETGKRVIPNVYNIEVKDNHNYFVNGLLVANCGAKTFTDLLPEFQHVYYKFGFSGTFLRGDSKTMDMHGFLSEIIYNYPAKKATEEGYLTPTCYKIHTILGKGSRNYHKEYTDNYCGKKFFSDIVDIVLDIPKDEQILILTDRKEKSGEALFKMISGFRKECVYVSGDENKEQIQQHIEDFNDKKVKIMIGTTVIGEGIDVHSTQHLILANGGKSVIKIVQAIGRCVRKHEGKEKSYIYDFNFAGTTYLEGHLSQRLKIYKDNFDGEIRFQKTRRT